MVKAAKRQGSVDRLQSVESDGDSVGTLGQSGPATAARSWQRPGTADTTALAATTGQSDVSAARQPQ